MNKPYYIGFWYISESLYKLLWQFGQVIELDIIGVGIFFGVEITKDECMFIVLKYPGCYIMDRGVFTQLVAMTRDEAIAILTELRLTNISWQLNIS